MAINIADNFSYKGKKPLDARIKYDSIASMVATSSNDLYDGCFAYVTETKKNYQYDSSNTEDETLGKWREFKGGASDFDELTNRPQKEVTSIDSIIDPIPLPQHAQLGSVGFTPCGTIIAYYGETAPRNYLACDGSEYNKTDYPELWAHLSSLTDTTPYEVDGDNTKFKVPDLRGEFLRGTGTNSHTDGGNGSNVGVHRGATKIVSFSIKKDGLETQLHFNSEEANEYDWINCTNNDKYITADTRMSVSLSGKTTSSQDTTTVTVRPTNTSVLYCIAYKNIYIDAHVEVTQKYSTEEQVIGEWIDGKPIYRKVYDYSSSPLGDTTINVSSLNIDKLIYSDALGCDSSSGYKTAPVWIVNSVSDSASRQIYLGTDKKLYIRGSMSTYYVIIEYTKTTD